jgi:hypothetical protein
MRVLFDSVAATIFAIVSLLHLLRIVFGWEVQIGVNTIPFWVSWGGMFAAAGLAVWGFALTNTTPKDRTA